MKLFKITLQTAKFGKNDPVSAMRHILCNSPDVATSIHVAPLNLSCIQNDNVVEDTPGTTTYSNFLFCMTNFFVSKAPFQFASCFLNQSIMVESWASFSKNKLGFPCICL